MIEEEKEIMDNFNMREERYFEELFENPREKNKVKGGND